MLYHRNKQEQVLMSYGSLVFIDTCTVSLLSFQIMTIVKFTWASVLTQISSVPRLLNEQLYSVVLHHSPLKLPAINAKYHEITSLYFLNCIAERMLYFSNEFSIDTRYFQQINL